MEEKQNKKLVEEMSGKNLISPFLPGDISLLKAESLEESVKYTMSKVFSTANSNNSKLTKFSINMEFTCEDGSVAEININASNKGCEYQTKHETIIDISEKE